MPGYPQYGYPQGGYTVPPPVIPLAPNGMPLANFGDRFVAYLIDWAVTLGVAILLLIPTVIGMVAYFATVSESDLNNSNPFVAIGPVLLIELGYVLLVGAWVYVYHVEMFNRTGITWGKRTMKLQILRLNDPATPVDRGVLAKRWAVQYLVGVVVPFWTYINGLWQLWDKPYQQCLHDKAAGTIVVKAG
ncbi:MAG TPA: RDD family protein [Dactylosporangium sp.]|jgi:uncharacterized RDD family membrane protein YckC|nr:RDD family protein [Dactylosporangium sp.]